MDNNKSVVPTIFIDQKKYRIRIHKCTLNSLGNPKFIQLLVNPKCMTIALRAGERADSISHRIVWKTFVIKQYYELHSRFLIQELQRVCKDWRSNESYKISGEFIPSEGIVRFDLRENQSCVHICEVQKV